ncbi:hypothetical protein IWQ57_000825 [Coemansia nantahalensis]|uniref:Uncharacterized protein n=1 Tax=Coemansia nantahalensis TaxID=2789366 RepID=A0ACC1K6U2_9FUNG|nr:hypothetical protein IWQ57_000825 [Coemansia nantahalensis]
MSMHTVMFTLAVATGVAAAAKAVYELWLSPLAHIPGPRMYAISSLPLRYWILRGKSGGLLAELHARYGPIVRVAPWRVSVSDGSAIRHVLGSHRYRKALVLGVPWVFAPNTLTTQSPAVNMARRRLLGPGFALQRLREMEPAILQCGVANLRYAIDETLSRGRALIQYRDLFTLVAFDTIGVLAFGTDFGAVRAGTHELLAALECARRLSKTNASLPSLGAAAALLGVVPQALRLLAQFASDAVSRRQAGAPPPMPDLLQLMLDASQAGGRHAALTHAEMASETALFMNAGMETTSTAMTSALLLLLHNPHILARLTADIRQKFPAADGAPPITFDDCREQLPLLGSIIDESLRLLGPVPYISRLVPAGGEVLLDRHIPEGTRVYCAFDAHHRDPRVFPQPGVFDPDRFMGADRAAARQHVLAFSVGARSCLGRNLAVVEMHVVLANLLRDYDLRLPAGDGGTPVKGLEGQSSTGIVPDIPRAEMPTTAPEFPDRDCLVIASRPPAPPL